MGSGVGGEGGLWGFGDARDDGHAQAEAFAVGGPGGGPALEGLEQPGGLAGTTFSSWRAEESSIPARHPGRAGRPGVDRQGGEPGDRRTVRHRQSHFAEALAHVAIEKDLRVAWFTLETLTAAIAKAKADGSIARTVTRICRGDLIVVDLCRPCNYADTGGTRPAAG